MMQKDVSTSYLFAGNAPYVEQLYEAYLNNPHSVPDNWREWFNAMQNVPASDGSSRHDVAHAPVIASFTERAKHGPFRHVVTPVSAEMERKQVASQQLTAAYRILGSRWANLDPLQRHPRPHIPELEHSFYGFTDADMDLVFNIGNTYFGVETATLREHLQFLRDTYCRSIGAEFMHISDQAQKRWMQQRLESTRATPDFTEEQKRHILERITAAEGLERYLHTRYVGQKRFSLEGSESVIAALDEVIQRAGANGIQEIVIGMAHRGRLNVLVNIMGKLPRDLFAEFEEKQAADLPSGDVKYHQGFTRDVATPGGPVHLSLAFNPSHLEIVNPVVEGSARARMDHRGDLDGSQVLPVLVHGDAAFTAQGVVMETLNLGQTRGFSTGGTVHIVINNQIGFTTSDPRDSRSTLYCTDVAKMVEAPVLHVNGDDPDAVVFAAQVALDFRMTFKKDIVLDIVCYRKLGHNEQDTPALTQPLMYQKIAQQQGVRRLYGRRLAAQGIIWQGEEEDVAASFRKVMDSGVFDTDPVFASYPNKTEVDWAPFLNRKWTDAADTAVPIEELMRLSERITTVPDDFELHPLAAKVLQDRAAMGRGEIELDWGMGEHLAFASLLASGYPIRLSGQDSGRGTFTHRHAVLHDQHRERWDVGTYTPLEHVSDRQARFTVIDSVLSEEAALGFEYGYSTAVPNTLTIWEAQFGDFANGAQVVIDQFITSGEVKWGRASGLVMLLPHGYEGQGPEHSSARIERFLQLCADNNIQVAQPTTSAQIFHLLRRQMIRRFRKPLIVLTPKSLLRHKDAGSPLTELAKGGFKTVIGETDDTLRADEVKRMLVCSGKVYYDLLHARKEQQSSDIAIIRIEQLYPFPHKAFGAELEKYPNLAEVVWVQDEPQNQGAWFQIQHNLLGQMETGQKLGFAGRPPSASPAVGYYHKHAAQQKELLAQAFARLKGVIFTK
ncbi:MAG: 2-oxoglutarate dehydrogenase component [Burkholderiaceae bacterium]|nr:2-oxoglutarate dehydrogenase component [Burkholderiaceae bacterium]